MNTNNVFFLNLIPTHLRKDQIQIIISLNRTKQNNIDNIIIWYGFIYTYNIDFAKIGPERCHNSIIFLIILHIQYFTKYITLMLLFNVYNFLYIILKYCLSSGVKSDYTVVCNVVVEQEESKHGDNGVDAGHLLQASSIHPPAIHPPSIHPCSPWAADVSCVPRLVLCVCFSLTYSLAVP